MEINGQMDEINEGNLDHYVEILDCNEQERNDKFKLSNFCSRFQIINLPANPENLLRQVFAKCMDDALELSTQNFGTRADQLGILVSSGLLDCDIYIPIRPIKEDTLDNFFNRFLTVMQSREKQGYGNIYGEPFSVHVHTVNVNSLPQRKQIRGSSRRKLSQIHHNPRRCALIKVSNPDNPYCLFYALELTRIYATKELNRNNFHYFLNHRQPQQRRQVIDLMVDARVPLHGLSDYDAVVYIPMIIDRFNEKYADKGLIFKAFVFGPCGHFNADYAYGPNNFNTPLAIYHDKNHFDGIRNVGGIFKDGYKYCYACQCPYRCAANHKKLCRAKCRNCGRVGGNRPCPHEDYLKKCQQCKKIFRNRDCYQHHLTSGECRRIKMCDKCGIIWRVENLQRKAKGVHVCGERYCQTCDQYHNPDRGCFIQPLALKEPKPYRLITFDFESTQHQSLNAANPGKKLHQVNFITANVACTSCLQNGEWKNSLEGKFCEICGKHRTVTFSHRPFEETRVDKQFVTDEPLKAFVDWILFKQNNKFTTMAFSHYGGKYDMILTFKQIYQLGLTPNLIRRGNKLYEMHVQNNKKLGNGEIYFRDSFNLCPVSLGALVGAFDLNVQEKQFFPHLANIPANYDKTIDLPPKLDYLYGGFTHKKQREFDAWYQEELRNGAKFNLQEKLAEYCLSDVQILTEALVAFRKEFLKISGGLDVIREAITIASACMKHFRLNHLKEKHLAIVPEMGYDRQDNQSKLALKYLQWYSDKNGVDIQTAISEGGEHKVGRYKLDGYIAAEDRAIEVNGCVWHAHDCRYKDPNNVLPNGKTVDKVRNDNAARNRYLKTQLRGGVTTIWTCEIKEQLKNDAQMRRAFEEYEDEGPIRIRDGFFGGRTGAFRMHYECPAGYKIKYYDFCSLYPFTTATTSFPVGHPKRHVIKRANQGVLWTNPDEIPIRGLLKVFIVPPRNIKVPVMPVKFDDRLLFPLCRACARQFPSGHVTPCYSCPHHSDVSRGWVSTCTHMELAESLKRGYKVTKYYRGWEYEQWDDGVFTNYVAEMMELKIHASGFPEGVDEQKYIQECREMFGIKLDPQKMNKNAAMRIIAKLMNNNLWGRFSLRNGLCRTKLTDCPAELRKFLQDESIDVVSLDVLTPDIIMITYEPVEEYVEENASSNLMLSLWVTSAARIRLLHALEKVADSPGAVLLYCDTDSVVFAYPENLPCPLQTGPHLGDLTDEFPDYDLVEFLSGGCKNYALRMIDKRTGEEKTVLRVRGITLTGDVCKKLHFETMKESVFKFGLPANGEEPMENGEDEQEDNYYYISTSYLNFIVPNLKKGNVISRPLCKYYRPVVSKGVVTKDLIIKDFGSN